MKSTDPKKKSSSKKKNVISNKNHMKGGEFVGQGLSACVFSPSMSCSDGRKVKGVSKVFQRAHEAEREYDMAKYVQKDIDPDGLFTNRIKDICNVNGKENLSMDYSDCYAVNKFDPNLKQIIYEHDGTGLLEVIHAREPLTVDFFQNMLNLLKGIQLLHKKKMSHFDIKIDHILSVKQKIGNKNTDKLLLIDFGLSVNYNEIYDHKTTGDYLSKMHYEYPPEFLLYSYLYDYIIIQNRSIVKLDVIEFLKHGLFSTTASWYEKYNSDGFDDIAKTHDLSLLYGGDDVQVQEQFLDFCLYIEDIIKSNVDILGDVGISSVNATSKKKQFLKSLFEQYVDKVDIFSFGMTLLKSLNVFHSYKKYTYSERVESQLLSFIYQTTLFDANHRMDVDTAVLKLQRIVTMLKKDKLEMTNLNNSNSYGNTYNNKWFQENIATQSANEKKRNNLRERKYTKKTLQRKSLKGQFMFPYNLTQQKTNQSSFNSEASASKSSSRGSLDDKLSKVQYLKRQVITLPSLQKQTTKLKPLTKTVKKEETYIQPFRQSPSTSRSSESKSDRISYSTKIIPFQQPSNTQSPKTKQYSKSSDSSNSRSSSKNKTVNKLTKGIDNTMKKLSPKKQPLRSRMIDMLSRNIGLSRKPTTKKITESKTKKSSPKSDQKPEEGNFLTKRINRMIKSFKTKK